MSAYKRIQKLKHQLKPISNCKPMIRAENLMYNYRINTQINNIIKEESIHISTQQYLKNIKHALGTDSLKKAVNKINDLKQKTNNKQPQKSQNQLTNLVATGIKNYQKKSANAVIPTTNQECTTIGKEAIKLVCLKHSDKQLSINDVLDMMKRRLNIMTSGISKLDSNSSNNSKDEPPIVPDYHQSSN